MPQKFTTRELIMLSGRLPLLLLLTALATVARAQPEYTFGVVPQFSPRQLATIWAPILTQLEQRTGFKFSMSGSARIASFEAEFQQGRFDFAYMNPYHALIAAETQGYEPLVRDGGRSLYGILVVANNSPIQNLTQLKGRTVAFPSPNALGASLLMRADLEKVHGIKVKPLYVKTHSSVYTQVLLGKVPAGGGVMSTLKQQKPEIQSALRVLYETRKIPPHPIVAHPRVSKADREKVKQALLGLGLSETGRALLAKIPIMRPLHEHLKFRVRC